MTGKGGALSAGWTPMLRFIERWFDPAEAVEAAAAERASEDACDAAEERMGLRMPLAVREWCRLCARHPVLGRGNNRVVPAEELAVRDERVDLYIENQCVLTWGVRLSDWHHDDPPVVATETNVGSLGEVNRTCSDFYFQMTLHQAHWASRAAFGYGDVASIVAEHYPRLDLPVWPWAGAKEAFTLYGDDDTVLNLDYTNHLLVSARTSDAFERAKRLFEAHWDRLD
ncbi:MAG: hypothetical protein AB8H86_22285 [Polyangiales bacterium]